MRKINLLIVITIFFIALTMQSCKKEIVEPTFNHITLSTEIEQVSYGSKPDYQINYTDNNVTNGEVTIQLLDENKTRLAWLSNSTLVEDNGVIGINNVPYLVEGKYYSFKIENFGYNNDYYQFNTSENADYQDEVLLEFKAHIKDGVKYPSTETFDLNVADNLGLQKAITYGGKIYGESITLNELSLFMNIKDVYPWDIFENIVLRDDEGLIIKERYIQGSNYWTSHNDSIYELKLYSLGYGIDPGYFAHQIDLEICNCISTAEMLVNLQGKYYNGSHKSFETETDTLRIRSF